MIHVYSSLSAVGSDRLLSHFMRLEREALSRRFHGAVSESLLRSYLSTADPVLVVTWEEDGVIRGVVEVHHAGVLAEAGLSLEADWRGRGLGHMMFERALGEAHMLGYGFIELYVTSHNSAMLSLSRSFDSHEERADAGVIRSVVETLSGQSLFAVL